MEEIARRNSKSVMACRDQTVALLKLLELEASAGRHAAVAAWAERELEVLTAKGVPLYPEHAEEVAEATLLRDVYRLIDQCVDNPALARRQEPKVAGRLLCIRAVVLRVPAAAPRSSKPLKNCLSCRTCPWPRSTRPKPVRLPPNPRVNHDRKSGPSASRRPCAPCGKPQRTRRYSRLSCPTCRTSRRCAMTRISSP